MDRDELVRFLRRYTIAVQASVGPEGAPQAAAIGFAVTDELELIFDTETTKRKFANLKRDPRIALVVGWDHEQTAQIEGTADVPEGAELDRVRAAYFETHPEGRARLTWPGIVHIRVRPTWIRFSDYTVSPPRIVEWTPEGRSTSKP